jgi:dTDP-4-amino-4,6-dideoxygalactose transaminase
MNISFVDLKAQYESITEEIDQVIFDVINSSSFIGGNYVKSFENNYASYCGSKHCIGVGNGTDALFIALRSLGIGKDDEVITAANSFIATSEAITLAGAKVVFADIDPDTYNIDADKIENKINRNTKAVIPVHLYGQPADMKPIIEIADKYGLKVINDAAQAHGSMFMGKPIAAFGDVTCFSFYPGKNLGAYGDAGAILTDNDELAIKARMIANHGRLDKYNHEIEGMNSRLDGLQAAVLNVKLKHLEKWTEMRRRNAYLYNEILKNSNLKIPVEPEGVRAVYHLYVVRVNPDIRKPLQDFLKNNGISTGIHYPVALPYLKAYSYLNHKPDDFPEALKASGEILSLPMFPELEENQIKYIADKISEFGL